MALQNMAFWRVKRGLLQGGRRLIGMHFVAFYKVGQVIGFTDKVLFDFNLYKKTAFVANGQLKLNMSLQRLLLCLSRVAHVAFAAKQARLILRVFVNQRLGLWVA